MMKIVGVYSFNGGKEFMERNHWQLFQEVEFVISKIDANKHLTKISKEKTKPGRILYNPVTMNKEFKKEFYTLGWEAVRVKCDYRTEYYTDNFENSRSFSGAFREMDYVKNKLGIEVQFGKYSFMVYNVAAKMTIFHNLGHINSGIEIVPIKELASNMSSGVSYFEQFVWDLENRGVSNIDIPVLILGVIF